jgi:hypothetical protein
VKSGAVFTFMHVIDKAQDVLRSSAAYCLLFSILQHSLGFFIFNVQIGVSVLSLSWHSYLHQCQNERLILTLWALMQECLFIWCE